jgi:hypothetical protein
LALLVVMLLAHAVHRLVEFRFQRSVAVTLERYLSSAPFVGPLLTRGLA